MNPDALTLQSEDRDPDSTSGLQQKLMAYVYILKSIRDGKYYIGSTTDIERRLKQHQQNQTSITSRYGGIELVLSQKYPTIREARIIERKLKKLKRKDYIGKMIKEGYIRMKP